MYYVHCPTHGARVLIFHDQVRAIVDTDRGIAVHLECHDGTSLVWDVERERSTAVGRTGGLQTSAA